MEILPHPVALNVNIKMLKLSRTNFLSKLKELQWQSHFVGWWAMISIILMKTASVDWSHCMSSVKAKHEFSWNFKSKDMICNYPVLLLYISMQTVSRICYYINIALLIWLKCLFSSQVKWIIYKNCEENLHVKHFWECCVSVKVIQSIM